MNESAVVHHTTVAERRYPVAPAKVFAAWSDAAQRRQWHFPGDGDWVLVDFEQDFRVGGHERARFGPRENPNLFDEGVFLDIVPDRRIVSAGTMHLDGERISVTLCTVELMPDDAGGTRVRLTDQSAFLGADESPTDRAAGWDQVFARLDAHLGRAN